MKILLWPTHYFPNIGGLEKMVRTLASVFRKQGHEALILSQAEKAGEYFVDAIPVYTFAFHSALDRYDFPQVQSILNRIREIIDRFSPDVVNFHGLVEYQAFYQLRLFDRRNIPLCLTAHGFLEEPFRQVSNSTKLWNRVDAVNTVSNALVLPQPHPFAQIIYNALPIPTAPPKPLPENRLLLVGRLTREKGFDSAFYALQLLLPKRSNLKLTLLGDGPDFKALSALKQRLDLPIEMVGFVPAEQVQEYLDESTLVLIPSTYESFSLVALEAALRGRPVVASRVMGLKEVVEEGKTGLLVDPQNPSQLAAAIDALLKDPVRMERMGKAAFERASRLFSLESTAKSYLEMYEKAADLCHHPCS